MSSTATAADPTSRLDSKGREKVQCLECNLYYHRLDVHISSKHGMDVKAYNRKHPGAPTISTAASEVAAKGKTGGVAGKTVPPKRPPGGFPAPVPSRAEAISDVEAVIKKPSSKEDDGVFKIGVARLTMCTALSAADQLHVPAHDPLWDMGKNEKESWEFLALGIQACDNVLIVGPTGCGKSSGVLQLAAVCNQPLRRINLHGDVRAADFVGDKTVDVEPKSGQAVVRWVDGVLVEAMRKGYWLLLDELDAAAAHILFVLQSVLEPGRSITLTGNGGEVVKAHPSFRIIATANAMGRGDDTGQYTGTNLLNEAFLDRFGVVLQVSYPDAATEADILFKRTGLNRDDCSKMVEVASAVRKAAKGDSVYCTFSTRRLVAWAQKAVMLGNVKRAATITVINRLGEDDSKTVGGLIQRSWGG